MTLPEKPADLTDEEWILLLVWFLDNNTTIIPKPTINEEQKDNALLAQRIEQIVSTD